MILKKCLIVFTGILTLHQFSKAQTVKVGVKAGINFTAISAYNNPTNSSYESKVYSNVNAGITTQIDWTNFSIQSGLFMDGKGGINTYINPESNTNRRKNVRLYYLQIPVNFMSRKETKAGTLYFGGGPYIAHGISGKYALSGIIFDSPVDGSEKVYFGNNEDSDYKRTDYGLNLKAEIRLLHGIGFELNYEYGLRNITTPGLYDDVGIKTRNKVFGIAVSYLIKNN